MAVGPKADGISYLRMARHHAPRVPFAHLAYTDRGDEAGTEQDYQNMRKRIARVQELFEVDRRRAQEMEANRTSS